MIKVTKINKYEIGLVFKNNELKKILKTGTHWIFNLFTKIEIIVASKIDYLFQNNKVEQIVKSGIIDESLAMVLELNDNQRAIIGKDNRIDKVIGPGVHILWKGFFEIKVEIVELINAKFEHTNLDEILRTQCVSELLNEFVVEEGHEGLYFQNSKFVEKLNPGRYVFWKNMGKVKLFHKDLRNQVENIGGQEIMTADRVTLRINAIIHYNLVDSLKAVLKVEDVEQAIYREGQLVLRDVIGTRELEQLLKNKDEMSNELERNLTKRVQEFGIKVTSFGIKDIILPGDMKDLLNKVIEAKKQSEANFIIRREETAAARSQANTARILESNPTLMRMRELEILEKIALNTNLQVVLGADGLNEKVMKLL